jgi:hypothetical protein
MSANRFAAAALPALFALTSCSSLPYDLSSVPVPVYAGPAPAGAATEPFAVKEKSVMWVHGLFGTDRPDVAAIVKDAAQGADAIADFRVEVGASGHDWFMTHLSLGFVRMKSVTVRGVRIKKAE